MSAYIIADVEIIDSEKYELYKQRVPATLEKYGGRFSVRGGKVETVEGSWAPKRLVILEFPSLDKAKAWYESAEYAEPKALRQSCSKGNFIIVEGA